MAIWINMTDIDVEDVEGDRCVLPDIQALEAAFNALLDTLRPLLGPAAPPVHGKATVEWQGYWKASSVIFGLEGVAKLWRTFFRGKLS